MAPTQSMDDAHKVALRKELLKALASERAAILDQAVAAHLFNDARLDRFLEGNNESVEEAATHFRKMLEWRRQEGLEQRRSQIADRPWSPDSVPGLRHLFQLMCVDASGYTAEGQMIWVQCDGRGRLDELLAIPQEQLLNTMVLQCELREDHLDRRSLENRSLCKVIQVRDLAGLSISKIMRDTSTMRRLGEVLKVVNLAYPETLQKLIVINAPAGFNLFWAAVQPMLNARIRSKFYFAGANFAEELHAIGGTGVLEGLARARQHRWKDPRGSLKVMAGETEYACSRALPGEEIRWKLAVGPEGDALTFTQQFFEDGGKATASQTQSVSGLCSGSHHATSGGVLWLTWTNSSWGSERQLQNLEVTRYHRSAMSCNPGPRPDSKLRRRQTSRSCAGCFDWLRPGSDDLISFAEEEAKQPWSSEGETITPASSVTSLSSTFSESSDSHVSSMVETDKRSLRVPMSILLSLLFVVIGYCLFLSKPLVAAR